MPIVNTENRAETLAQWKSDNPEKIKFIVGSIGEDQTNNPQVVWGYSGPEHSDIWMGEERKNKPVYAGFISPQGEKRFVIWGGSDSLGYEHDAVQLNAAATLIARVLLGEQSEVMVLNEKTRMIRLK